jgi:REP element-mobilizing transposase RayT
MPYYKRNLPHIHPQGRIFFITFRLADSIPEYVLTQYIHNKECFKKNIRKKMNGILNPHTQKKIEKKYFEKFDRVLAKNDGACWLKIPEIAHVIENKLHSFDSVRYNLICYCIMPNHVHLLIDPSQFDIAAKLNHDGPTRFYPLTDTLRLIKGSTARYSNQIICRTGPFWHHESYDHYIRNEKELYSIIKYILYNPVNARLVRDWQEWKFSYICW